MSSREICGQSKVVGSGEGGREKGNFEKVGKKE